MFITMHPKDNSLLYTMESEKVSYRETKNLCLKIIIKGKNRMTA